jgi:hypothetical protein
LAQWKNHHIAKNSGFGTFAVIREKKGVFFKCECAQFLWNAFFSRFGLAWAIIILLRTLGLGLLLQGVLLYTSCVEKKKEFFLTLLSLCTMACLVVCAFGHVRVFLSNYYTLMGIMKNRIMINRINPTPQTSNWVLD